MPTHLARKSKRIALALLLTLNAAPLTWAAPGADPNTTSAEGSSSSQPAAQPATAATAPAATNATAAASPTPVEVELQELKASVQAQAEQFTEHSKELEAERAALHSEIDRISALETKLGISPTAPALEPALSALNAPTSDASGSSTTHNSKPINVTENPNPLSIKIGGAELPRAGLSTLPESSAARTSAPPILEPVSPTCRTTTLCLRASFRSSDLRDKARVSR